MQNHQKKRENHGNLWEPEAQTKTGIIAVLFARFFAAEIYVFPSKHMYRNKCEGVWLTRHAHRAFTSWYREKHFQYRKDRQKPVGRAIGPNQLVTVNSCEAIYPGQVKKQTNAQERNGGKETWLV